MDHLIAGRATPPLRHTIESCVFWGVMALSLRFVLGLANDVAPAASTSAKLSAIGATVIAMAVWAVIAMGISILMFGSFQLWRRARQLPIPSQLIVALQIQGITHDSPLLQQVFRHYRQPIHHLIRNLQHDEKFPFRRGYTILELEALAMLIAVAVKRAAQTR